MDPWWSQWQLIVVPPNSAFCHFMITHLTQALWEAGQSYYAFLVKSFSHIQTWLIHFSSLYLLKLTASFLLFLAFWIRQNRLDNAVVATLKSQWLHPTIFLVHFTYYLWVGRESLPIKVVTQGSKQPPDGYNANRKRVCWRAWHWQWNTPG